MSWCLDGGACDGGSDDDGDGGGDGDGNDGQATIIGDDELFSVDFVAFNCVCRGDFYNGCHDWMTPPAKGLLVG